MLEWPEVIVIGSVALLIFGPKRLPEMARSIGQGIKEFRKATQEGMHTLTESGSQPALACASCNQPLKDELAKFCPQCGKSVSRAVNG